MAIAVLVYLLIGAVITALCQFFWGSASWDRYFLTIIAWPLVLFVHGVLRR